MTQRLAGRLLFFSVAQTELFLGYVTSPDSEIATEFNKTEFDSVHGVFSVIDLPKAKNNRAVLLGELKRIHELGWIDSKRLDSNGNVLDCRAPNCGGYTLEAELGVTPNGYSNLILWVGKLSNLVLRILIALNPKPLR